MHTVRTRLQHGLINVFKLLELENKVKQKVEESQPRLVRMFPGQDQCVNIQFKVTIKTTHNLK